MAWKVVLVCCITLAHAGIHGPNYSPAPAVSYSSIRFGTPSKNSAPIEYVVAATPCESLLTDARKIKTFNENQQIIKTPASSNVGTAPTYTEAIYPQYVPSGSRVLNLAKPILASRNIPQAPSPDFASVPSVLKTEGLSAYASFPIKSSEPTLYSPAVKGLSSSTSSVLPSQTVTYTKAPEVTGYYSAKGNRDLSSFSSRSPNKAQTYEVNYSEQPAVSHVSVSSSGTNYSW